MEGSDRGRMSELAVSSRLIELGHTVMEPVTTEPFDLVAEIGDEMEKIQVKTARTREHGNSFKVDLQCRSGVYSPDDVDSFCIYYPGNDTVYYVPYDESSIHMSFHLGTGNGKKETLAESYELDRKV